MASRKEERERLRAERLAAQRAASRDERRRLIVGYLVAGALIAVIVAGIVVAVMNSGGGAAEDAEVNEAAGIDPNTGASHMLADLTPDEREGTPPPPVEQAAPERAAQEAGCELELGLEDEGNAHIPEGAKPPDYETTPPASGDHSAENLPDGAYLDPPNPVNSLHSLEHGRVAIQYDPDLPAEDQLALKGLFDSDPQGMLMFPNPDMRYEVAATAWTNMLTCERYDPAVIDALRAFRDEFRGLGPEDVPL